MRIKLFFLSLFFLVIFILFSYSVAKEGWQKIDFDTTVKLQDHISRRFDGIFSYFSLLGSAEVTIGLAFILSTLFLIKMRFWASLGWLMIIPASLIEVFGKLVLYHPGPPVFFHRSLLSTSLPSFYIHTDFSYPSGHMTRTIFLVVAFLIIVFFSWKNKFYKIAAVLGLLVFGFMMFLTRIYLGEHWLSDVIGGSLLGTATAFLSSSLILAKRKALS